MCIDNIEEAIRLGYEKENKYRSKMDGIELIKKERDKQITKYNYTPKHDFGYHNKELLFAALAYLNAAIYGDSVGSKDWPFNIESFKPEGYHSNLKKAGAFIAAELDRIQFKEENDN